MNDDRPKKVFTRLPENYQQLSEEERKQWTKEASAAILESLKRRDPKPKRD